jgi:alkylhydroperoxidase/carboxymuconolactone decarboxylase family protein YurZ
LVTDSIAAYSAGVTELADAVRAAGATEAEIIEVIEVGYLYGGTVALVIGVNAFPS